MTEDFRPSLIHLTGPRRGTTHPLASERLLIGTAPEADVHLPAGRAPVVEPRHAELRSGRDGWRIEARGGAALLVNGEEVASGRLLPGDVIQLGSEGPLLRYRLEPVGSEYKSLRDALADCVACARYGADSVPAQVGLLIRSMPGELLTRTSPWVRGLMATGILAGLAATGYQVIQSQRLGERLTRTRARLEAVTESLRAEARAVTMTPARLDSFRRAAVRAAERTAAVRRGGPEILAEASRSVMLVVGSYGFEDPVTGRSLHMRRSGAGRAARSLHPVPPGTEGSRPLLRHYTGTAFAVTDRGHFATNRHLVRPWAQDEVARTLMDAGFRPVLRNLTGYLPGRSEPIQLALVAESDSADLALLGAPELEEPPAPLPLAREGVQVGREVYLLGYPTGPRALLARSDPTFVAELRRDGADPSPRELIRRLAREGVVSPLTTRGIVGQRTGSAVVYDAETSQGGSGGPVLGPGGRVVAVNKGLMPEFGGSNLGVPVRHVRRLLEKAGVAP